MQTDPQASVWIMRDERERVHSQLILGSSGNRQYSRDLPSVRSSENHQIHVGLGDLRCLPGRPDREVDRHVDLPNVTALAQNVDLGFLEVRRKLPRTLVPSLKRLQCRISPPDDLAVQSVWEGDS